MESDDGIPPTGDELIEMLAALANPLRVRIVAQLTGGRDYVKSPSSDLEAWIGRRRRAVEK